LLLESFRLLGRWKRESPFSPIVKTFVLGYRALLRMVQDLVVRARRFLVAAWNSHLCCLLIGRSAQIFAQMFRRSGWISMESVVLSDLVDRWALGLLLFLPSSFTGLMVPRSRPWPLFPAVLCVLAIQQSRGTHVYIPLRVVVTQTLGKPGPPNFFFELPVYPWFFFVANDLRRIAFPGEPLVSSVLSTCHHSPDSLVPFREGTARLRRDDRYSCCFFAWIPSPHS